MKNKYVGSFRNDFMDLTLEKDLIDIRLGRINKQNEEGRLSKEYYKEMLAEAKKEYEDKADEFRRKLTEMENKYIKDLDKWTTLNSEKINDDNKILESGLPLTADDYRNLEQKNSSNYTMLSLIQNHAKERGVHYKKTITIDKKEKMAAFKKIINDVRKAEREFSTGKEPYISVTWRGEGWYESVYEYQIQQLDFK